MIRLSDLNPGTRQFFITAVKASHQDNTWTISINQDPPVGITANDRCETFENPNSSLAKRGFRRWPCGGIVFIEKQGSKRFLALTLCDNLAPAHPNQLTNAGGLGTSQEEWYNPLLAIMRESLEETARFFPRSKRLIIPNIDVPRGTIAFQDEVSISSLKDRIMTKTYYKCLYPHVAKFFPDFEKPPTITDLPTISIDTNADSDVIINHGNKTNMVHGIVYHDQERNGINFSKIFELDLPDEEIVYIDCEQTKDDNYLDRKILIFDLDNIQTKEDEFFFQNKARKIQGQRLWLKGSKIGYQHGASFRNDPDKWFACNPSAGHKIKIALRHYGII